MLRIGWTRVVWLLAVIGASFAPALAKGQEYTFHGSEINLDAIRDLPTLEGQRFKPFDSFAREWVRKITGKERFEKQDPVAVFLTWRADPETARTLPFIRVPSAKCAEALDLPIGIAHERVSYDKLMEIELRKTANKIISEVEPKARSTEQNEILTLYSVGFLGFAEITGLSDAPGAWLPIVPPASGMIEGETYRWASPYSSQSMTQRSTEEMMPIRAAVEQIDKAFLANDDAAFASSVADLKAATKKLGYPSQFTGDEMMAREVVLNGVDPFFRSWILYAIASFLGILAVLLRSRIMWAIPMVVMIAGLGLQSWGMWERTVLSQRALIGNFFESMVFVAACFILLGVIFELIFRKGWYQLGGASMGFMTLAVATSNPDFMDPSISQLRPVLINNYWIHIHVPTIMASYAALGLSALMGHFYLIRYLIQGHRRADMREMARFIFWLVPVGVILLFAGIILGGVWADDSWGRFWGWDPKETAALITWIVFMVVIHGRWAGWLRDFGTSIGTMVGGWALLWTYYGANFFQTGLHSYAGANASKEIPTWLIIFTGFELLLLAAAVIRHRSLSTSEPAVTSGASEQAA